MGQKRRSNGYGNGYGNSYSNGYSNSNTTYGLDPNTPPYQKQYDYQTKTPQPQRPQHQPYQPNDCYGYGMNPNAQFMGKPSVFVDNNSQGAMGYCPTYGMNPQPQTPPQNNPYAQQSPYDHPAYTNMNTNMNKATEPEVPTTYRFGPTKSEGPTPFNDPRLKFTKSSLFGDIADDERHHRADAEFAKNLSPEDAAEAAAANRERDEMNEMFKQFMMASVADGEPFGEPFNEPENPMSSIEANKMIFGIDYGRN